MTSSSSNTPERNESQVLRVRFPMTASIWNLVVVDCPRSIAGVVDEENSDSFTMEYDSQSFFDRELSRFQGLIPYEILPAGDTSHE